MGPGPVNFGCIFDDFFWGDTLSDGKSDIFYIFFESEFGLIPKNNNGLQREFSVMGYSGFGPFAKSAPKNRRLDPQ